MIEQGLGITCPGCGHHLPFSGVGAHMAGLTRRQAQLLDLIVNYAVANKRLPTYEAIAAEIDSKSKSSVSRMVTALTDHGFVTRTPSRTASIQLTAKTKALYRMAADA